ncbi:MAG: MarR family winged helix-turn-helix transcriptional regulator [Armatimonadota bacterium]
MNTPTPSVSRSRKLEKADYEALAAFRRALRRFLHHSDEGARQAGVTPQQHQLLLAIKGQRGRDWASITDLADALQVRHHAAVGLVDRSERSGLVRRTTDPEDGRQVRVVLTEAGEEVLDHLSQWNRQELATLRRALDLSFLEEELADPVSD